jgi:dolichyl-phosphate beta-glucosyltransferase
MMSAIVDPPTFPVSGTRRGYRPREHRHTETPVRLDLEIVIPTYNEERRIARTVAALTGHLARMPLTAGLRVVDNGSVDATAAVIDGLPTGDVPVAVTGCSRPGKGAAISRGMTTARARWVGFCDADLPISPAALDDAVRLLEGGWQVVIGSRRCPGGRIEIAQPPLRRLGGAGFRALTRRYAGPVADTQCGFKFFDAESARQLFTETRLHGFAFDLEILARAHALGLRTTEFAVSWADQAESTFRPLTDGARVAAEVWRLRRALASEGGARR